MHIRQPSTHKFSSLNDLSSASPSQRLLRRSSQSNASESDQSLCKCFGPIYPFEGPLCYSSDAGDGLNCVKKAVFFCRVFDVGSKEAAHFGMDVFYGDMEAVEAQASATWTYFMNREARFSRIMPTAATKKARTWVTKCFSLEVRVASAAGPVRGRYFCREGGFGLLVHFPNLGAADWEHVEAVGI